MSVEMWDWWKYCPYCGIKIDHERILPINGCANQCIGKGD